MAHTCKAVIIHCMDFRLIEQTRNWMAGKGILGDCDVVSLAGASKEIADGSEGARALLLKQIATASNLHQAGKVILLHHSDCGAYKASYNFSSAAEEKDRQIEDMRKAEEIIKEKFSGLEVIKIWAQMKDGEGREVEFQPIE